MKKRKGRRLGKKKKEREILAASLPGRRRTRKKRKGRCQEKIDPVLEENKRTKYAFIAISNVLVRSVFVVGKQDGKQTLASACMMHMYGKI